MKLLLLIITHLLSPSPNSPASREAPALATELAEYGDKYGVDPVLLTVMAFQESSLQRGRVGALGEVGMFQVHGMSRRACEGAGVDPNGVECGALLIDLNRRFCGSMRRGLHRYMCGTCNGTPRARRKTEHRLAKAARLKGVFDAD